MVKKPIISTLAISLLFAVSMSSAIASGDGHSHGHDSGHEEKGHGSSHDGHDMDHNDGHAHGNKNMGMSMAGMFLKKKQIDGYTVSFHVMKAKDGMRHGGSHNFMIKVEKNGKALSNIKVNSKVVHPNKKSESKMLMKMGDWYMAGYDLGHKGRHQLMILFKTPDGKKHSGGVYFEQ